MSRCFDAIGTNEDAGGGTREWHGRDVRRRARYDARVAANRARARVRGKTGRVSAPRAVPTDSDATKRHSAFRRDSSENPRFPNCRVVRFPRSTRVSTSRVPSWGVSCLCQPERGRSRAPSPRATSPERSFGSTDHANPRSAFRFVFRALALTSRRRTRSLVRPMLGRRRIDRRDQPTRFTAVPRASPSASRRP